MNWQSMAHFVIPLVALVFAGADWPQWRGPHRDGMSRETGLLQAWPENGPKLLWKVADAGSGYSTPAVAGDRIYLLGNEGLENEFVQARSAADGKVVWSTKIGRVGNPNQTPPYPGARSTPTLDGDLLYVLGSDGDLACLETASGKVRWQKSVRAEFGGQPGIWAYSESPLIDGNTVVCTPGGEKATIVALDKKSGSVIWQSAVPGGDEAGYSSAVVVEAGGVKQYVQFLAKGVVGVDAKTGKFLWRYEKTAEGSPANIPTPVTDRDYVYTAAGRSGGGLVRLAGDNGTVAVQQVYFSAKLPTAIGGSVKIGNYLYGTNSQGLMCVDFATGDVKWQERCVGAGSVCFADGCLYVYGESGEAALVEATPDAYREKGRFTAPSSPDRGRSKTWAYPVVANGRLYLRDMGVVSCYDVRK